jgi:hypothetical protein
MNEPISSAAGGGSLRQRLIDDMNMRPFSRKTQRNCIRDVGRFATIVGRPPDAATAKNLRRFQAEQREAGVPVPKMSSIVSTLRFFFTHTLDRPDLAHRLVGVTHPRTLPAAAKPQRSRLPAECDDLPQAPGGAVGRLWRRPSPRRGLKPQGQRHPRIKSGDQRAHVAQGQAWQRRAISQRHALGGYARLASPATIARVSGATGSRR